MSGLTVDDLREVAEARLAGLEDGAHLDDLQIALVRYALAVSPSCLNVEAADAAASQALAEGGTAAMLHEVIVLVSGLGVHSLMTMSARLPLPDASDKTRDELWNKFVGDNPYWTQFETQVPGFLGALLAHSPAAFEGFFQYCSLPWTNRTLSSRTMELISLAVDACPAHRFGPGFRLHLENALSLGLSRRQILETMDLAAASDGHVGVH